MLKVLIADDEIWVCQLIKNTIDWAGLGMEPLGFAHNGQEGYQMICRLHPDIVITDVRMPAMSGIEMIQKVRATAEMEKSPYFIIISGYQDFEYVQTALRLGAADYLLKPYDEDALLRALIQIQEKIGVDTSRVRNDQLVRQKLAESIGKLRETGLYDFFHAHVKVKTLEKFNQNYSFSFTVDHFSLLYVRVSSVTGAAVSQSLLTYVAEHLINYFQNLGACTVFPYIENGSVVVVINHPIALNKGMKKFVQQAFSQLLGDAAINKQVMVSMGFADCPASVANLTELFHKARDCADLRFFSGYGRIYYMSQFDRKKSPVSERFPADAEARFKSAVESFRTDKLRSVLADIYKPLLEGDSIHPGELYDLANLVVRQFCDITSHLKIPTERLVSAEDLLFPLELCANVTDFPVALYGAISEALLALQQFTQDGPSQPIKSAMAYVEQHYGESVRLTDIALQVYLTPQYFSELFKSETGVNFSDYLASYRIQKAKKLLVQPGEKVKDICHKVGYSDSKSFSKLFKKVVGITPREYQRLYS